MGNQITKPEKSRTQPQSKSVALIKPSIKQQHSIIPKKTQADLSKSEIKMNPFSHDQISFYQNQTNIDPHEEFDLNFHKTMSQISPNQKFYQFGNENELEYLLDGIGSFFCGDQTSTGQKKEIRKQQASAYNEYPLKANVRIISIFEATPKQKPWDFQTGSGFLLTPRIVFTVAHNAWQQNLNITPDYIFVQPQTEDQPKKLIRVIKFGTHKGYLSLKNDKREKYDFAILILEENDVIKPNMTLKIKNRYDFQTQKDKQITIAGFPKDTYKQEQKRFTQFSYDFKIDYFGQNFLFYQKTTSGGQSGAPLIQKFINNQGRADYVAIGLHKGWRGDKSYGIVITNENKIEIVQLAREFAIMNHKDQQEVESKNNKLIQLLKTIEQKQSKGQPVVQIDNIIWKSLTKHAVSLESLVCKNDPESFRSAIYKFSECIKPYFKQVKLQNIFSQVVWEQFYSSKTITKSVFGIQEQQEYFGIVEDYVDYSFGHKKQIKETEFYTKIGQRLYSLENKLLFKTNADQIKKEREFTLSKMGHQLIQKREIIIQKIKKGPSAALKGKKDKKQRIESQLYFMLKLNSFSQVQKFIDRIQQEDENDRILLLKADICKNIGSIKRAIIIYDIVRKKNISGGKGKQSFEYTQAIKKRGQIHRTRKQTVKCYQYFHENMQIRGRMDPQKKTIEYAEALNCLASYEIDTKKYKEAIENIKQALEIAENVYGANSIELVKYLMNLSVVYYEKSQTTNSIDCSRRSLQIIQNFKGKNSIELIEITNNLGAACIRSKKFLQAFKYYQRGLQIQEVYRGKESHFCAPLLNNIAYSHFLLQNYAECENAAKKSIEIFEKLLNEANEINRSGYGLAFYHLALLHSTQNKFQQAFQQAQKALKILKETSANDLQLKNVLHLLETCKKNLK